MPSDKNNKTFCVGIAYFGGRVCLCGERGRTNRNTLKLTIPDVKIPNLNYESSETWHATSGHHPWPHMTQNISFRYVYVVTSKRSSKHGLSKTWWFWCQKNHAHRIYIHVFKIHIFHQLFEEPSYIVLTKHWILCVDMDPKYPKMWNAFGSKHFGHRNSQPVQVTWWWCYGKETLQGRYSNNAREGPVAHWSTWAKTQRTQEHHHLAVWAKALQVKGNGSAKGLARRISKETRDIGPKGRKERAVGEDTKAKQGQAIDWHDTVQHDSRQPREAVARVQHGLSQRRCVPSAI